jgi:PEGA domain
MNHVLRHRVSTGIVGLFLASTCYAGVDSSPANPRQTHDILSINSLRPVTILSQPAGARILINGDYVGTTPLHVDFMVDKLGRAVRSIEMRAVAPEPLVTWEIRRFPAAGTDGYASRIPHLIDFDLNIQPVYVIR